MSGVSSDVRVDFIVRQINGLRSRATREVHNKRKPISTALAAGAAFMALAGGVLSLATSPLLGAFCLALSSMMLVFLSLRIVSSRATDQSYQAFKGLLESDLETGALGAITAGAFEDIFNPRVHKDAAKALTEIYSPSTIVTARNFSGLCDDTLKQLLLLSCKK